MKRIIYGLCMLTLLGCDKIKNTVGLGNKLPDAGAHQIGFYIPYYWQQNQGREADDFKELVKARITIFPMELMGRTSGSSGTPRQRLESAVRAFPATYKHAIAAGGRPHLYIWNSNSDSGSQIKLSDLNWAIDELKRQGCTDMYVNAMNEDDGNANTAMRNGVRAHLLNVWDSKLIYTPSNEIHPQGLAARTAYVTDSCGAIMRHIKTRVCRETNSEQMNGKAAADQCRAAFKAGRNTIIYNFLTRVNLAEAKTFATEVRK